MSTRVLELLESAAMGKPLQPVNRAERLAEHEALLAPTQPQSKHMLGVCPEGAILVSSGPCSTHQDSRLWA